LVRTLNEAVTAAMNELGNRHGCRPMNWYLPEVNGFDRGDVIGFPGPDIDEPAHGVLVAERWATLLGLAEQANESGRYRSWVGVAGTSRIEIWCRATMTPAGVS
jgi:hypothetical protein